MIDRRDFMKIILASAAAPAIVRAESLMRGIGIVVPTHQIVLPENTIVVPELEKFSRILSVLAYSNEAMDAQLEGLPIVRTYRSFHGVEMIDFGLKKRMTNEEYWARKKSPYEPIFYGSYK